MPEENGVVETVTKAMSSDVQECTSCRWWTRAKPLPEAVELWGMEMFPFGECRGMPPTALSGDRRLQAANDPSGDTFINVKQARFPHTYPTDWCGMWKACIK